MFKLNDKQKEILEFYLKLLPILTALMIVLGYLFMSSYYDQFDIEIIQYLDVSEILVGSFLILFKFLITPLVILMSIIFIYYLMNDTIKSLSPKRQNQIELALFVLFSLLWIFVKPLSIQVMGWAIKDIFYLIMACFMLHFLFKFFRRQTLDDEKKQLKMMALTMIITMFTIFIHLGGVFYGEKYMSLKDRFGNKPGKITVTFLYNNQQIKTTDKLIYIGQTRNYIFLHDTRTKENQIYQVAQVNNLKIKTLKNKVDWGKLSPFGK